jgi:probable biosynthetic protein (TIGR04098 family)
MTSAEVLPDRLIHPAVWRTEDGSVRRLLVIKPGMCGHNSLLVGQIGDWTWDTVSETCGVDVYTARGVGGQPSYLSFYYFHIRSGTTLDPSALSFGDRLEVTSRVFGFGSESVLTLHRLRRVGPDARAGTNGDPGLDPDEFFTAPRPDSVYVQNFNRWISRSRPDSNKALVSCSPAEFEYRHLPTLPKKFSPRLTCGRARAARSFHDPGRDPGWDPLIAGYDVEYPVDITRDLNGVGLLYFASYFSIVDRALLALWRHRGRDDRVFLRRAVLDHQMCYLGNADLDSVLRIRLSAWRNRANHQEEIWNAAMEDRASGRALAVCTLRVRLEQSDTEDR